MWGTRSGPLTLLSEGWRPPAATGWPSSAGTSSWGLASGAGECRCRPSAFLVVLPWLALLFPIPTPPGGQSSPNLSAGSSIARQVVGLDSRTNGAGCWGVSGVNGRIGVSWWWCSSVVPYSAIFLPVGSLLIFGAWHAVLCPLADYSLVAPHSTLALTYRCGYPARFPLGSP